MTENAQETAYQGLLQSLLHYVERHEDPNVVRFWPQVRDWGEENCPVGRETLPAARHLPALLENAVPQGQDLLSRLIAAGETLRWEQSYKKSDGFVSDDMLADYGFVEVIGKLGPYVSERVRAGVGVWGPNITYAEHHHRAEEVYVLLSGSAEFLISGRREPRRAGESAFIPSLTRHGFTTGQDPIAVFYIWQSGDLRETSTFG